MTVTVTAIPGEIKSNDFQDGNWESMEMKGCCGRQDGNGNGN